MSLIERVRDYLEYHELKSGYTGVLEVDVDLAQYQLLVWTEAYNRIHVQSPEVSAMIATMIDG